MNLYDTIAAISTPMGVGGIAVIRISGEKAIEICAKIFELKSNRSLNDVASHTVHFGYIKDKENYIIDEVLTTVMKAPKTFTGEDVVEISCHGGNITVKQVLKELIKNGARLALNGEFTKRAFLNGKMDLSQAEAVIDIIHATSEISASSSENQLYGVLKDKVTYLRENLLDITSNIIAVIDYPDEEIDDIEINKMISSLRSTKQEIDILIESYHTGKIIRDGAKIVIAGKPNVGKSSILNALLKEQRAIVTDIEGTTRDILEESLSIDGLSVRIFDTAGVRESSDLVESIGINKTLENIQNSDLVLFIVDKSRTLSKEDYQLIEEIKNKNVFAILNKSDLEEQTNIEQLKKLLGDIKYLEISAKTFDGINNMAREIKNAILSGEVNVKENIYITNERHFERLSSAMAHIKKAIENLSMGMFPDIVTIDIENAISALGEITGVTINEEIVNNIFSKFCVGK